MLEAWSLEVCASRACGNGALGADEQCDDGNRQSGDGCSAHCEVEVCNSFAAPAGSLVIPNPGSVSKVVAINNVGAVTDVDVDNLLGTNTWVGDLVFDLRGPSGSSVNLIDRQQCSFAQDFSISLDDEAAAGPVAGDAVCPLAQSGAPFIPNVRLAGLRR
jgi:cysteine-rich repeat protein